MSAFDVEVVAHQTSVADDEVAVVKQQRLPDQES